MSENRLNIPFEEQETHAYIEYIENQGHVYSNHKPTIKTLRRYVEEYPSEVSAEIDDDYGYQISVPMSWIRIRPPKKYSDETKKRMADNMRTVRQAR